MNYLAGTLIIWYKVDYSTIAATWKASEDRGALGKLGNGVHTKRSKLQSCHGMQWRRLTETAEGWRLLWREPLFHKEGRRIGQARQVYPRSSLLSFIIPEGFLFFQDLDHSTKNQAQARPWERFSQKGAKSLAAEKRLITAKLIKRSFKLSNFSPSQSLYRLLSLPTSK